jgi:hypothetical protein
MGPRQTFALLVLVSVSVFKASAAPNTPAGTTPNALIAAAVASGAVLGESSSANLSGTVVSVQFPQYYDHSVVNPMSTENYTAGVVPVQNWNVADTDTGTSPASNKTPLITSTGAASTLGFTYSGYTTNDLSNNKAFPAAIWYQSGGLADAFVAGGSSFNQTGAPESLVLNGLNTTHTYSLIVYMTAPWWGNSGSDPATVSAGGTTYSIETSNTLGVWTQASSTSSVAPQIGNYVLFSNLTGAATQTVTITGAYVGVAGFQIIDNGTSTGAPAPTTYALTVNSGTGSGSYAAGTVVTVTASAPAAGYSFAGWTGSTSALASTTAQTTTLTMPAAAATITATYVAAPTYALKVNSGTGSGSYTAGTVVTVTANVPASGYTFAGWTGTTSALASTSAQTTTLTMPASAATITATYVAAPTYALTVNSGTGGGSYTAGTVVTVTANAPTSGYAFAAWTGSTATLSSTTAQTATLTMPAAAATITATYAATTSTSSGTVVSVQFPQYYVHSVVNPMSTDNYTGGVVPVQNWNVADTDTGTSPASNKTPLVTSTGATTTLGFTYSGYTTNDLSNNKSFPAAIWYQSGGLADAFLAGGSTFNQTGAPEYLTLNGLNPAHAYSLIVYITAPWWENNGSDPASVSAGETTYYIETSNTLGVWTQASSVSSVAPQIGNYVLFSNLTGAATQTVTITGAYVGVAGFQIIDNGTSTSAPAPTTYALTVNSGTGSGNYAAGTVVTVTANAPASGYTFAGWTGTTSALASTTAQTTTFTMPAAAAAITATYAAKTTATYALTVNSGTGSGTYAAGTVVTVTANTPASGYTFAGWTGTTSALASTTAQTTTLTMPAAAATITATYAAVPTYALTVNSGSGSGSYTAGTVVTVTANAPASGYTFAGWTGSTSALASTTAQTTTLTMPAAAATITATYVATPTYALTVNSGTGSGSYAAGTVVTVTANAPASGYTFAGWTGSTSALANASALTTTLTMPAAVTSITASYTTGLSTTPGTVTSVQFPQYYVGSVVDPMNGNDFSGGVVVAQSWNVADTNTGTSPASNTATLVNSTGAATSVGFTYSGYTNNDGTANKAFPSPIWFQEGGLTDLYIAGGSTFNETGAQQTLVITGLNATHTYSLYLYVTSPWWQNNGSNPGSVSLGGTTYYIETSNTLGAWTRATSTSPGAPSVGNYVEYANLTGATSQTITLTGSYVGLAGFQVLDNATAAGNPVSGSLPALPTWYLTSDPAAGTATQVTVLPASQPITTGPPGAIFNIGANFNATSSLSATDTLNFDIVNSYGAIVATASNNLNNGYTLLPTTQWNGPLSITTSMTIPSVPNGTYYIMMSLNNANGPVQMTPGSGVVEDNEVRYYIGALSVNSSAAAPSYLAPATLNLTGYKLTFDDEFTKLSISDSSVNDGSNWYTLNELCCLTPTDGSGAAMVGITSAYNPFSLISGGGLDIRLQKNSNNWTSGVLTSVDSHGIGFSQQYGYFEMKAQLPTGLDTWPAFWLLNTAAKSSGAPPGEIDIMEYISNPAFPNYIATTLHDWSNSSTVDLSHNLVTLPTNGYHTYGMLWTATTMTFYFDGTVTFQCPTPSIMQQPYYLLVDLGIGGGWPTNGTPSPDDMLVQYVRAYSLP